MNMVYKYLCSLYSVLMCFVCVCSFAKPALSTWADQSEFRDASLETRCCNVDVFGLNKIMKQNMAARVRCVRAWFQSVLMFKCNPDNKRHVFFKHKSHILWRKKNR